MLSTVSNVNPANRTVRCVVAIRPAFNASMVSTDRTVSSVPTVVSNVERYLPA
jgi:hypothetical protein